MKHEFIAAQEKTSQDVVKKIGNITYQFKNKGHEHRYHFKCGVEEAINSTRTDLESLNPNEKAALQSANAKLDEGIKALATKQKHIKIVDHSDHGWRMVVHYQEDPIASGPEDEKEIEQEESRAEKDTKKEAERGDRKHPRGGDGVLGVPSFPSGVTFKAPV